MSSSHGTLIVFGSGPGVGRTVAAVFAERGFRRIILVSRNASRLDQDADFVRSAHADATVHTIPADLSNPDAVKKCLEEVGEVLQGTPPECILFNAFRPGRSEILQFPAESFENDFRLAVLSLYTIVQWAMPQLLDTASNNGKTPALLVTSGMLAKDPFPAMFSLASVKAAQYSLVHSLHKEYETKGVHCAAIVIGGKVSEESQVTNPRNIADQAWKALGQPKGEGKLEFTIMDPAFAEHVKSRER